MSTSKSHLLHLLADGESERPADDSGEFRLEEETPHKKQIFVRTITVPARQTRAGPANLLSFADDDGEGPRFEYPSMRVCLRDDRRQAEKLLRQSRHTRGRLILAASVVNGMGNGALSDTKGIGCCSGSFVWKRSS